MFIIEVYFYYIKNQYIEYLKRTELKQRGFTCVPNMGYKGKKPKFTYGAVLKINGVDYYVPVSHYAKEQQDLILLRDKKNRRQILGSLRFNYMIPVPEFEISLVDFTEKDSKELAFCRRNREKIYSKAENTYYRVTEGGSAELKNNSCDFLLLEQAYREYLQSVGDPGNT